jgi:hypothetical protein
MSKSAGHCGRKHSSKSKCAKHLIVGTFFEVEILKQYTPLFRAKQPSKSKCTKHTSFGARLKVAMSKNRAPLWREAHVEVKRLKTQQVRTTFGG